MNFLSKIVSVSIREGVRFIKTTVFGRSDVRECEEIGPFGIDSAVPSEYIALYADTDATGDNVVIGYIKKNAITEPGETRIYSTDDKGDEVKFFIHMFTDGTCHVGGDADFMVRFNELKSGFDQLKGDFNDLVQKYNTHVHAGVTPGPGSTGVTPSVQTPSTASIDASKIEEIKTL